MNTFTIGRRVVLGGVGLWPIHLSRDTVSKSTTDFASLEFEELPDADPNMIAARNPTSSPAVIPSGITVSGLNQNRMIHSPLMVPAGMTIGVPVFCIEKHRFGNYTSPSISGRAPERYWLSRKDSVTGKAPQRRAPESEQADLWHEIWELDYGIAGGSNAPLDDLLKKQVSGVETAPFDWGDASGFALELEGSIMKIELYANTADARYMSFASASAYRGLFHEPHLFETQYSVSKLVSRVVEGALSTFPKADYLLTELRDPSDMIVYTEFVNFQNRVLMTI